jgi:replicative DNA helicase
LRLDEGDFMNHQNKSILGALKSFYKECASLDLTLFLEYLKKTDSLEKCGGVSRIVNTAASVGVVYDYDQYFQEIKNLSAIRKLILINKDAIELSMKKDAKYEEVSRDLFKQLFSIDCEGNSKTYHPSDLLDEYSEHGTFEEHGKWMRDQVAKGLTPYTGVASNFPILDKTLGFFRPGAIYYVGARTSMGKTTFMLNLVISMLSKGTPFPIGIFSLEMPAKMIIAKILCLMADVKYSAYEDACILPEQYERIMERASHARKLPILIEDDEDMTISKIRSRARRLVQNEGAKIIFIDYLTRIKSDTKYATKHLQVDEISKGLQSMAKELNVPVICLAQLNRASEDKAGSVPTLSSFRESGSIEEDCDGAILLHRPEYYDPIDRPGLLQFIIAKNRIRGRLRTIGFSKLPYSERFDENADIKEDIKKRNEALYGTGSVEDLDNYLKTGERI